MISVGILSYYAPKTLERTLQTYKDAGIFDLTDDIFAVLQQSTRQRDEKIVCETFGVRTIELPDNKKMGKGFKTIWENAKYEHILFLENDFIINTTKDNTKLFFNNASILLNNGIDIVRGRSRENPGKPNYAYHLHTQPRSALVDCTHLSECIFWETNPDEVYPSRITKIDSTDGPYPWYRSLSKYCNYTNNPYICSKDFFKKAILPYTTDGSTIEDTLTDTWATKEYICAFGPGLFTHWRGYDGHT
jgi:hypothetical protein